MKANFELVESLRQRRREIEINAYGHELIITTAGTELGGICH
jgi:hypothetical protein